jgi:tRNA modification GTPase
VDTIVAITTPKGVAAISSIELFGSRAAEIIKKVFESNRNNNCEFVKGQVYTGRIFTDNQTVDHVVLGVLDTNGFEINCHGNPLIVEKIINLLVDLGASPVSAETLFLAKLRTDKLLNFIQVESSTAKLKAVTPKGIELITNQPEIGLGKSTAEWLNNIAPNNLDEIKCQCHQILETSKNAKYLIEPVKAVITGAPNAGKSTLLNALAGKEKAIVTNVAGTTRDWVSTT